MALTHSDLHWNDYTDYLIYSIIASFLLTIVKDDIYEIYIKHSLIALVQTYRLATK